jgi:type IV secretory pathway component VirB8
MVHHTNNEHFLAYCSCLIYFGIITIQQTTLLMVLLRQVYSILVHRISAEKGNSYIIEPTKKSHNSEDCIPLFVALF